MSPLPLPRWRLFQLTPPRGGRPQHGEYRIILNGFNSRPREGGDSGSIHKLNMNDKHQIQRERRARWTVCESNKKQFHFKLQTIKAFHIARKC